MPASHVKTALAQLEEKFKAELQSSNISLKEIKTFGTCRRLGLGGLCSPNQEDREEVVVGPPKAVAIQPDGSYSQAAEGFAKAQGISVENLQVIKTEKGEYVGLKKVVKGKPTQDILQLVVPQVISSLVFPKMMRWGEGSFRFSRPIHNVLCLLGGKLVPFTLAGTASRAYTFGHKIYFPQQIKVNSFQAYRDALEEKKVVVEQEKRRRMIETQIEKILTPLNARLFRDEDLLEVLSCDVEYPYVFLGSFPEKFLDLPLEVLSTALREGQKLFSVIKDSNQVPYFLGVADAISDANSFIQKGNERVLKARLEDARFFWEEDRKKPLVKRIKALADVVFQENLGSYLDKSQRLKQITAYLAGKLDEDTLKANLAQAAELCKVDLLTEMVREFPSLQGKVGGLYAKAEGYPAPVWRALYEHYQPLSLEDESPATMGGALLSLADKMDSLVGAVGVGVRVTGSKDPFGLRRLAHGVCKVILDKKISFSLSLLLDKVLKIYGDKLHSPAEEIKKYCLDFFSNRLQYIFERKGYRYDLINASLHAGIDNIYYTSLRLKALDALKETPQFEHLVLIAKRVNNIIQNQPPYKVNEDLFLEKDERELYSTFSIIKENVTPMISRGDFTQAQKIILRLRPPMNNFFDKVLVMAEDKKMRSNRLALLQEISKLLLKMADYSQIVIKG